MWKRCCRRAGGAGVRGADALVGDGPGQLAGRPRSRLRPAPGNKTKAVRAVDTLTERQGGGSGRWHSTPRQRQRAQPVKMFRPLTLDDKADATSAQPAAGLNLLLCLPSTLGRCACQQGPWRSGRPRNGSGRSRECSEQTVGGQGTAVEGQAKAVEGQAKAVEGQAKVVNRRTTGTSRRGQHPRRTLRGHVVSAYSCSRDYP